MMALPIWSKGSAQGSEARCQPDLQEEGVIGIVRLRSAERGGDEYAFGQPVRAKQFAVVFGNGGPNDGSGPRQAESVPCRRSYRPGVPGLGVKTRRFRAFNHAGCTRVPSGSAYQSVWWHHY